MEDTESGFSLLETLVAFTVLSLVLLSAMELFGDGAKRVAMAQQRVTDLKRLQNAVALVRTGVDPKKLDTDISVTIRQIDPQNFGTYGLQPYVLEVSSGSGNDVVTLKTIVLREQ